MTKLEQQIIDASTLLSNLGLLTGKSGNLSARKNTDQIVVTPTQKDYSTLTPNDLVIVDLRGNVIKGKLNPTSELPMHLEIYKRRPKVQAIIHTHTTYATVLAVAHSKLPAIIDESTIKLGGDISVSKYAVAGTEELAKNVAESLGTKNASLIANHGCVTVGRNISEALENMILLEHTAQIYVISKIFGTYHQLQQSRLYYSRLYHVGPQPYKAVFYSFDYYLSSCRVLNLGTMLMLHRTYKVHTSYSVSMIMVSNNLTLGTKTVLKLLFCLTCRSSLGDTM